MDTSGARSRRPRFARTPDARRENGVLAVDKSANGNGAEATSQ